MKNYVLVTLTLFWLQLTLLDMFLRNELVDKERIIMRLAAKAQRD